ncbi:MAG: S9 family peptidase [Acidobacteriota bacterium]|nr:MAG: S9 family peptidase [Acidobacteriota bacterium]
MRITDFGRRKSLLSILRKSAILVLVVGVSLSTWGGASARQQAARASAKRPITHQDYDAWRSIQGQQLSRDGKYLAYSLIPQDGDGEVVARNLATGREWRHGRGWRRPAAPPSDPEAAQQAFQAGGRATRPEFSADSRYLIFTIEPDKAEVLKATREKKRPEEMPKNALGIMDLSTGTVTRIERVRGVQVPDDGAGYIAYQLEAKVEPAKPEEKKEEKPSDASDQARGQRGAQGPARGPRKEYGTDLILRNLATGAERTFNDALDYSFSKDAKTLLFAVSSKNEESNGLFAVAPGDESAPAGLLAGKGKYTRLTWDEDQTQMAFLSDRDDAAAKQPKFKVYHWDRKSSSAREVVSAGTAGVRPGYVVSERGGLGFSRDGSRLFLGLAPAPEPEKDPDEAAPNDEKVVVDLWHWKDDFIQPMQRVRANQERNRSYRAVYHIKDGRFTALADETMQNVNPTSDGRWAIGADDRAYRRLVGIDANYSDVYLVDTNDGSRKELLKKQQINPSWSTNGRYMLFYDGKDWNTISVPDGKRTNLTAGLGVKFWREDHDTPNTPFPYGSAGWTTDDRYVLLYDEYDIWQVAADGSGAKNLTDGLGRKEKIEFRYVRLDPEERGIDPAKPLLLRAQNDWTRDSGYYRDRINGGMPEKLIMLPKSLGNPVKAKDADVLILTASRFDEYPEIHVTDSNFRNLRKATDAGAQMNQFAWGKAELVRYKNMDGVDLSGILIKPDNFDPKKQYPMMVYIYEKLSDGLHRFVNPSPGTSINASYYASNGYLVLMPDIVYTIGYPGHSALKCVLPAIQAVVDQGFVKEDAIGIQGHSWGGYQIAYMVTQTDRFRAAAPGALVGNMTSAYSGIRWGTGLPRQFQYERTQSRIGGSIWEYPMRFIENSPVFHAHRIRTPILMLHNDQDDAVPWYQGIEFYLALRRMEKEVYMFNYNGEFHGLRRRQNQKDYTRRLQEFFDHFLKGAPKPAWMENGIPFIDREKDQEKYRTEGDKK